MCPLPDTSRSMSVSEEVHLQRKRSVRYNSGVKIGNLKFRTLEVTHVEPCYTTPGHDFGRL